MYHDVTMNIVLSVERVKFGMENGGGKGEKILKILEKVEMNSRHNISCAICWDCYVFMSVVIGIMIWSAV